MDAIRFTMAIIIPVTIIEVTTVFYHESGHWASVSKQRRSPVKNVNIKSFRSSKKVAI